MKTLFRIALPAASLAGLSLVSPAVASPLADSAAGVGTVLGNSLSASAQNARPLDPEWVKAKRTPTGSMFKLPFDVPKAADIQKSTSGWEYSGQLEFGVIGGDADERNAQFRMYQDPGEGAYVNNFSLQLKKPEGGYYVDVTGGGAGRHDQYYGLQFGRYNDWKVKLFFSETPHIFTDRYKTIWSGIGTDQLTLLPGLTAGGTATTATDNANVLATALNGPPITLGLTRKRAGVRIDANLSTTWKAYLGYSLEERKGARPFGAVWGAANTGGTAPMEIPEPIDYSTHDLLAGLTHVDGVNAFNLRLSASLFRNHISTLTFEEPYRIAPGAGVTSVPAAGAFTQGRMDLAPSNQAYNARAEYTRSLPNFHKGYITAVVSAGKWRQDDTLLPYTTIPNLSLANVTLLPGGGWDTTGSLSRRSTDATIDTRLADLTFSVNPTDALNLKAKARYQETKNDTDPFLAVNPNAVYVDADAATAGNQTRGLTLDGITGVWGRLINDGTGQSILYGANATPAGNIPIKSAVYGSKLFRFGPTAEYRLSKLTSFNGSVEREVTSRTDRVRDRTWEDKAKLGYVNRGVRDATVRLSYEFDRRRGSAYRVSSYDDDFSSALVPIPTTAGTNVASWAVRNNSGLRTLDLADRDQHIVNARLDTMVRPDLDAGLSFQAREAKFPDADYGRTRQGQRSANLDLNYQPSPRQTIYAFYSYQLGKYRQAAIANANANVTIGQTTPFGVVTPANAIDYGSAPGGLVYPLLSTWGADSTDRNHVTGFGLKQEIGKLSLNIDYSYSTGRTRLDYSYNVGGALNAAQALLAGSRMPDMATDVNYLDASLRIPLTTRFSARLIYRYQKEVIRDWHYLNLAATPVVAANVNATPTAVVLDGGPQSYRVNWFGVMFQVKL
ncbi:MAG: MtrB/PioB family outer membrane beta-barrel protein [Verrucomicrobia bacterium]|nr:MtrB/PioB family outer membrane beta-barrel protein [Verrucomicrobiota bacterium]